MRYDLQHFLGGLDHGRQHQQRQCHGTFETVDGARSNQNHEHREREQTGDDGRNTAHHVDQQCDDASQLATVGIFNQVHGAHQTDRNGDDHGAERDFQRTDDGVLNAAVTTGRRRIAADHTGHVIAQEVEVQPLDTVDDGGEQHREQRNQRHNERKSDQHAHRKILALTCSGKGTSRLELVEIDDGGTIHRRSVVIHCGHHALAFSVSLRAMKFTTKVIRNSTKPVPISTDTPRSLASGYCAAMLAAIVWFCEACSSLME